eukprot:gb/GECG01001630.1/.p1 GENE.gb/GECG01001630.1/~~gb/GECG01001630.1/.p1  ORF type:complete len:486 (+),score=95.51 gb/GECG01001630.1/:1-1458(+)
MLDHFAVLSKTGLVLWSECLKEEEEEHDAPLAQRKQETVMHQPLNALVKNVLLEHRQSQTSYNYEDFSMKWALANELDIIFVVVFNRIIGSHLTYLDDLLMAVKKEFLKLFKDQLKSNSLLDIAGKLEFSASFHRIWNAVENASDRRRKPNEARPPDKHEVIDEDGRMNQENEQEKDDGSSAESKDEGQGSNEDEAENEDNLTPRQKLQRLKGRRKGPGPRKGKVGDSKSKIGSDTGKGSKGKAKAEKSKLSKDDIKALDVNNALADQDNQSRVDYTGNSVLDHDDASDEEEESSSWFSSTTIGSLLGSLTGNKTLQAQDVDPILDELRSKLMEKNVGSDIAEDLCKSVASSLIGKKLERLTLVQTQVKKALQEAIERLLTPTRSTDVLADIRGKKMRGDKRPYVIVFIGVNGVGKSTSLSKVVYYLKDNGLKVMMAACDSFRSGAVEQLNRHAQSLDVPLFQRGYNTDPVSIAREGMVISLRSG